MPKISVIMSVYNGEKYLKEAIDSILGQTFDDFEFIIIDDESTDNSLKIIESYIDKRIRTIKNKHNIGLTKSLNKALKESQGEYVARMDGDDISLPKRLEIQNKFLDENKEIACIGCSCQNIDNNGNIISNKVSQSNEHLLKFFMVFKNLMTHPTTMYRKSVVMELGGYDEKCPYSQDYQLWSKMLHNKIRIKNIPDTLLRYRIHSDSITQGLSKDRSYKIAMSISKNNIRKYMDISDDEFEVMSSSYHRRTIPTFSALVKSWLLWDRLFKSYTEKESLPVEEFNFIKDFIYREKKYAFKFYIKNKIWKQK